MARQILGKGLGLMSPSDGGDKVVVWTRTSSYGVRTVLDAALTDQLKRFGGERVDPLKRYVVMRLAFFHGCQHVSQCVCGMQGTHSGPGLVGGLED